MRGERGGVGGGGWGGRWGEMGILREMNSHTFTRMKNRKSRFPKPLEQPPNIRDDLSHGRNVIPLLFQVPAW